MLLWWRTNENLKETMVEKEVATRKSKNATGIEKVTRKAATYHVLIAEGPAIVRNIV